MVGALVDQLNNMSFANIIFLIILFSSISLFVFNFKKIIRNISLGKSEDRSDNKLERLKILLRLAFGQKKMFKKPFVALLHLVVYLGFIIINIEVLEILIDGVFGTHRVFSFLGWSYNFLIASFEILALLVIIACMVFFVRRNLVNIKRLSHVELKGWPKQDANLILIFEILLMSAFLIMNANDIILQQSSDYHYPKVGSYPVSSLIMPLFSDFSESVCFFIERFCWWFHIIGILCFLNYLVISKHLHIILGFPNIYYSNLKPQGQFVNMSSVTKEVKLMMDPNVDPFAQNNENDNNTERFGAKDVTDLSWVQLLNAYSCTECGRCTSECPASTTGKKLSPRKIMMNVRDRSSELGKHIDKNKDNREDGKSLLHDFITTEEIWACTSCNACVEACPLNIDPLSIIIDLRRYLVMEESAAPSELNTVFSNIENNGAPWKFPASDRLNWKENE